MKKPRRPNRDSELGNFLNELMDWIESISVQPGPDISVTRAPSGSFLKSRQQGSGDGTSVSLQFKGPWNSGTSYLQNDIVTVDPGTYPDLAGTYIAQSDVPSGGPIPGGETRAASAHATLSGGVITGIVVDDGGFGYVGSTAVVISGDGTGATAHVTTTDGRITGVVVDAGGSGYTTVSITFDDPAVPWEVFAFGNWPGLQFDTPQQDVTGIGNVQRAELHSSGGMEGSTGYPILFMAKNTGDTTSGAAIADTNVIDGHKVYFQALVVCTPDGPKQRFFWCSDEFDL